MGMRRKLFPTYPVRRVVDLCGGIVSNVRRRTCKGETSVVERRCCHLLPRIWLVYDIAVISSWFHPAGGREFYVHTTDRSMLT